MKTITKIALCFVIVVSSVSCAEQTQTVKEYSIDDIINNSKPITLADMGVELETIKLKTPDGTVIPSPSFVRTTPTSIYLALYPAQILRFDREGNFLNKISTQGRAKNEYTAIYSIFEDPNGNICVQDWLRNLAFTPEGEYVEPNEENQAEEKRTASSSFSCLIFMDKMGNTFKSYNVMYGIEPYNLVVTNPAKDTLLANINHIKYERNESDGIRMSFDLRATYSVGDEIVFQQKFCDTVYTYDYSNNSLKPRFYFTNPTPMGNEEFKSMADGTAKDLTFVADLTEDNKYIYAFIWAHKKYELYLIDKLSGESFKADFNLNHSEYDELKFMPLWESNDEFAFFYDESEKPDPTIVLMKKL